MAALPHGILRSDHVIQSMEWDIALRAQRYHDVMGVPPGLSIVSANPEHGPSKTYMNLKKTTGEALGMVVHLGTYDDLSLMRRQIDLANTLRTVNGIVVQLPLTDEDHDKTDEVLDMIDPAKDVDGLGPDSAFTPATPRGANMWEKGLGIDCREFKTAMRGLGRLFGAPFYKLQKEQGARIVGYDKYSDPEEIRQGLNDADIIYTATGQAEALTLDMFEPDTHPKILVDVGTAEQDGVIRGDVSPEVYAWALAHGWGFPPKKGIGGMGSYTVRALLLNGMDAAEAQAGIDEPLEPYRFRALLAATSALRPFDKRAREDDRLMREHLLEAPEQLETTSVPAALLS